MSRTVKNVVLLAVCQGLFMTTTSTVVTVGALTGDMLAPDHALATLPFALMFVATSAMTLPASFYMKRFGRRAGFLTGVVLGVVGATVAALGVMLGSFWLFSLGLVFIGGFSGFAFYYRFAAAEIADPAFRPKAISLVLAGGVAAAFTGPNLARLTAEALPPYTYAGSFLALIAVYLMVAAVVMWTDLPRPTIAERTAVGRPLSQIARQPAFVTAVLGATVGHAVMMLVMTVTPIAMGEAGCSLGDTAFVIQGHILGMYVPAFFTGHLISRLGVLNVMMAGAVLLAACVGINLTGQTVAHFTLALILLGVGWNFLFVGSTTLLTTVHSPAERAKVQGVNDLCVYTVVTVTVLSSGMLQNLLGWDAVNLAVMPFVAVALLASGLLLVLRRRQAA